MGFGPSRLALCFLPAARGLLSPAQPPGGLFPLQPPSVPSRRPSPAAGPQPPASPLPLYSLPGAGLPPRRPSPRSPFVAPLGAAAVLGAARGRDPGHTRAREPRRPGAVPAAPLRQAASRPGPRRARTPAHRPPPRRRPRRPSAPGRLAPWSAPRPDAGPPTARTALRRRPRQVPRHPRSTPVPLLRTRPMDAPTAPSAGFHVGDITVPGTHPPIVPAAPSSELTHGGTPYIAGLGPIPAASPLPMRRSSPPGFPAFAPPTWSHRVAPSTDSPLVGTLATIQAAVTASRERAHAASLALERERALGAALTTQMATTQRLLGRPTLADAEPPADPHASDLDADLIAALHAQAAGLHNIRALVSVVLDPASSHYPRWRGQVLLTLRRFVLDDHVLVDHDAPPPRSWCLMDSRSYQWSAAFRGPGHPSSIDWGSHPPFTCRPGGPSSDFHDRRGSSLPQGRPWERRLLSWRFLRPGWRPRKVPNMRNTAEKTGLDQPTSVNSTLPSGDIMRLTTRITTD
eukprot:XP_020398845.1 uncharacterized protein LOC109941965 [Zea mays]